MHTETCVTRFCHVGSSLFYVNPLLQKPIQMYVHIVEKYKWVTRIWKKEWHESDSKSKWYTQTSEIRVCVPKICFDFTMNKSESNQYSLKRDQMRLRVVKSAANQTTYDIRRGENVLTPAPNLSPPQGPPSCTMCAQLSISRGNYRDRKLLDLFIGTLALHVVLLVVLRSIPSLLSNCLYLHKLVGQGSCYRRQ